ncbi:MAG: ATP-binding cassette domain-containing protein [Nannocystaceae bacterium]
MADDADSRRPIIEMRGVDKAFGPNVIFEGMDLTVYEGETLSILGESGSGKSICLKMMLALASPDRGSIKAYGREVGELDDEALLQLRRDVAYVFQDDALFDSMDILHNVGYALYEHTQMSDEEIRERVIQCLLSVNLPERVVDQYPADLSGGMRKRVGLARAIALQPKVILFDDPTRGLDPQSITIIGRMLKRLHRELKTTSVLATHDLRTALHVSDRLAILEERRFPYIGTIDELRALDEPEIEGFLYDPEEELWGNVMDD